VIFGLAAAVSGVDMGWSRNALEVSVETIRQEFSLHNDRGSRRPVLAVEIHRDEPLANPSPSVPPC